MTNRYIPELPYLTWDGKAHTRDANKLVTEMFNAYLHCAEWADKPEDEDWGEASFSTEVMDLAWFECCAFLRLAGPHIQDWTMEQIGHDFWLTRNHHGAGFWDRDIATKGVRDKLTAIAQMFGECSPYIGDDGNIWIA